MPAVRIWSWCEGERATTSQSTLDKHFDQKTRPETEGRPCDREIFKRPLVPQRPEGQSWGAAGPFTLTCPGGFLGEQPFH